MSAKWEPGRNAVHGLIQLIDVLAIALNCFRQLSFKLPHHLHDTYRAERERLLDEYREITRAVFPAADFAPQYTAARIADRALAELVRAGSGDEGAVREAQQWMSRRGWVFVPRVAPNWTVEPEPWRAFDGEGELLGQYLPLRLRLTSALARVGQTLPDEIVRRSHLSALSFTNPDEEPVAQSTLLRWISETGLTGATHTGGDTTQQYSPAVARHLDRWRDAAAQHENDVQTYHATAETTREAAAAWERVVVYLVNSPYSDERMTYDESRAEYVERVMALGETLRGGGYEQRVRKLDAGEDAPRCVAVELLRHAVAGNRAAVDHLDAAMRAVPFCGGFEAMEYFRQDLRFEVLGIRRPAPRPSGWEGPDLEYEVRTATDLLAWLDNEIQFSGAFSHGRDQTNSGACVRNAHRLLTKLDIEHPYPFPPGGMTDGEEEAHLRNLRGVCLAAVRAAAAGGRDVGRGGKAVAPDSPTAKPGPSQVGEGVLKFTQPTAVEVQVPPGGVGPSASEAPDESGKRPSADAQAAIIEAIRRAGRPLPRSELAGKAGYKQGTIGHYAAWMVKNGLLCSTGDGYDLPPDGVNAAEAV